MIEWRIGDDSRLRARFAARGQLQQRLGSFRRQVVGQRKQRRAVCLPDVVYPFGRHTVAERLFIGCDREDRHGAGRLCGLGRRDELGLHVDGYHDLFNGLANLDELRRTGGRMGLQLAPLGPIVRLVVVADEAKQQAGVAPMNDHPDVATDPHRPEILVFRLIEFVEAHAWIGGIELQVERRCLDRLLLVAGEASEAIGEGIGDPEFHAQDLGSRSPTCSIWPGVARCSASSS